MDENKLPTLGLGEDEMFDKAVALVTKTRKASVSYIKSELKVGKNRAKGIIEEMEVQGIISPTGEYDVLLSLEEFEQAFAIAQENGSTFDNDEMFDKAVALVTKNGKASISYIKTELKIGYNRAVGIIEKMESQGVISPETENGEHNVL